MLTMHTSDIRPFVPQPLAPPPAIHAWPAVFWRTNSRRHPAFKHLATRVTSPRGECEPCTGHTIWRGLAGGDPAALAWDWIEIAIGVVAMVDPMRVSTNMQIVNVRGDVLTSSEAAPLFNQFVRRLPWQEEVQRLLQPQ